MFHGIFGLYDNALRSADWVPNEPNVWPLYLVVKPRIKLWPKVGTERDLFLVYHTWFVNHWCWQKWNKQSGMERVILLRIDLMSVGLRFFWPWPSERTFPRSKKASVKQETRGNKSGSVWRIMFLFSLGREIFFETEWKRGTIRKWRRHVFVPHE